MKPFIVSILAACAGFALGFALRTPEATGPAPSPAARTSIPRARPWSAAKLPPSTRLQAVADKAASLGRDEWPAFFRAQLNSPDCSRFAARLWAEADPAGFWAWLREDFDPLVFEQFAPDLVQVWALTAPDAAMDAVAAITEKRLGGALRRRVIDAVIDHDLRKGIELAARAGDFNRFGWGPRKWMKRDPEAAVTSLAGLPAVSDYRRFLNYAMPIWAETDPAAALSWIATAPVLPRDEWVKSGFAALAKTDPDAAIETARAITNSRARADALAGIVSSGNLDPETMRQVIAEMPPAAKRMLGHDLIRSRPARTTADLMESTALLLQLPSERNNLDGIDSLARQWRTMDPQAGWQWAATLPEAVMRRSAFGVLSATATPEQLGQLPMLDLSNDIFRTALSRIPRDNRDAWIARLPTALRSWAETARPEE